jgi:integrase
VSEVCNLDKEDIYFEKFTIAVKNTKNKVDRTVIVTKKCIRAIERYLETRDDTEKPLSFPERKGGSQEIR